MFEVRTGTDILFNQMRYTIDSDRKTLDAYLGDQEPWRYFLGALCVIPMTIIKLIGDLFSTSAWCFKTPVAEKERTGIGLSTSDLKDFAKYEVLRKLNGNYNTEVISQESSPLMRNPVVKPLSPTEDSAIMLRSYLKANSNKLKGVILKTTYPRIKGEELLQYTQTGDKQKPFIVQRITFGNDINSAIKLLLGKKIKHRKMKGIEDTYIVLEDNEVLELERALSELFMEEITVVLKRKTT